MVRGNSEVSRFQRRICSWTMTSVLVAAVLFIFFQEKAIAKGLVLGAVFSVINFLLLGKTLPMTLGRSRARAGLIGFASILTRYAILAIPMVIAVRSVSFNFVAVVVGIFAVQIVTLLDQFVIRPIQEGK
ncbi:MAG: ATP synthase subunit I [Deltaproteobacteria bacterium]|nr:ATP synthase subunit I [Deltaproteobacteria bacterium]